MPKRSSKPKDYQQLARSILDAVVPDAEPAKIEPEKPVEKEKTRAVALGRLGGLKGGKARAEKLSAKKRSEIAKKAAESRWKKQENSKDTPPTDAD